ncbi:HD-GYP domain-containing protein [Thermotoga sp. SG1]|uniref:HD-GYP domain-containing protein n=1 Tax=Thermotoga sp. SG1 TaxID=126739 RepID=UPI000C76B190|nr:HD-GYP domain-containing protein [Thermotoga sp. SG1]PLV56853.1 metal-dependent phosphohydrolase [Thermotoga sp. SG1]
MKCFFEEEDFEEIVEKMDRLYTKVDNLEESDIAFLKRKVPFSGISVVREKNNYTIYKGEEKLLEIPENSRELPVVAAYVLAGEKMLTASWTRRMVSGLLQAMIVLMEIEDENGWSHSQRVTRLAERVGKKLGLSEKRLSFLKECAMLHDVGKIGIEQLMLYTPTRIQIFEQYPQDHTIMGSVFLASLEVLWDAVPIVRHHHENWDGTGYPDGLKGEEIPLEARIIAVCDYYDVLTNFVSSEWEGRVKTHDEAIEMIKKEAGRKFDPTVVDAFLKIFSDETVE